MSKPPESHASESRIAAVHHLEYGRPAYPEPASGKKTITLHIPGSLLLILLEIPWFFLAGLAHLIARMGHAKDVFIDSLFFICIALPAIAAIIFAARQWLAWRSRDSKISLLLSVVAVLSASKFLFYMFGIWYSEAWLDRAGHWDML